MLLVWPWRLLNKQIYWLVFYDFVKKTKPQDPEQKKLKSDVLDSVSALVKGRELMYNAFRSGIFHRLEKSQEGDRT